MRIITQVEQLKEANSAVSVDLELASLASYIDNAEAEIIRIIGEATLTEVLDAPVGLSLLRRAVVDLALADYSSSGAIEISNKGIHVTKSEKYLPASDKKLLNFRLDSFNRGWRSFEQLIVVIEASPMGYPQWRASHHRTDYFNTLFRDSGEFSSFGGIGISASLFKVLKPIIQRVQEDVLYNQYGEDLVDSIITKRLAGALTPDERKLERKLMQVLAPTALAEAIPYQMVQIQEGAVYTASIAALSSGSDNVLQLSAVEQSRLRSLLFRLSTEGESKMVGTLKWLKENASKFQDFKGVDRVVYPIEKVNDPDSNIYLL